MTGGAGASSAAHGPDEARDVEAALREVAERFVSALGPDRLIEFPVTQLDRVGVPVWATWWTGADGRGESTTSGLGYGATELRARVGALGECVEHVGSRLALAGREVERGSTREMRRRHGHHGVVDPRLLGLPAGTDFDDDRPLAWWALRRLRGGSLTDEQVLAPAELVASARGELPAEAAPGGWLVTPVTNGLGAGGRLEQAIAHGVLEVLQRDGNGLTFRAMDTGVVLDLDGVRDAETLAVLDRLRAAGVDVVAKLAATDFGMANIDVVGMADDDDILSATACGEAVHPDREEALRKAVLEFASARARKQLMHGPLDAVRGVAPPEFLAQVEAVDPAGEEQRVLAAMLAWLRAPREHWEPLLRGKVLARRTTVRFTDLPSEAVAGDDVLAVLCGRLESEGHEVLVADLSPAPEDGVHAAKVLVPGLEVETVAYGRIGERNVRRLVQAGRTDLVRVGEAPAGWARVHLTAEAEQRLGGPAWLDRHALDAVAGSLLPLYREPGWHAAQVALARAGAGGQSAMRT
ncbi:YcaO-like family protein [Nocardioides xinjiangensis]|uniref:YcaO-like family protein n=1 Tax=Nocardioides xinjiangensis TaxID=2817376 RepID=UPI001B3044F1|nr:MULTISPECIES: YcaO-like family protein [unclassified Nocardioides]